KGGGGGFRAILRAAVILEGGGDDRGAPRGRPNPLARRVARGRRAERQSPMSWQSRAGTLFETEKRPAHGSRGMVVTNHPLASAAGADMLAGGGNAVDAAIAALFTLSVVEPMMVGPFGAGHTVLRLADGALTVIDNYTTAPAAARPDLYRPVSD